ncbi:site-specific DNA-methyltransferase [Paraliobacillus ryukyuensis]|uniref:site-specific DNA-methyltransferase n=1 Tax=Paraliobacillus ryukyuensis TaxID=200904 RepID=UPI0009A76E10|nr:site-specific DNA-methyltransferase [Paraliobacillus ryukyuensis]
MEKLDGKTFDVINDNIEKLKEIFPEVVTEGKIDFEKLQQALGENVEKFKERYDFTWHGKSKAIQLAQKQTTGTLRPYKKESINWGSTGNLYIEGDNLEVLRVLQNSYRNKIKMIYIDPPYNTGRDFVYKDDFYDNVKNYKERLKEHMKSNAQTNGRFHTEWLNMIYPRLKIAKNLLTNDGVIFISIDDNEVYNLKKILDEIYGEQNHVATIANIANPKGRSDSKFIATGHEYILIYAKNINLLNFGGFELDEKITRRYNKIDEGGRKYRETDLKKGGFGDKREDRPAMFYYFIFDEKTGEFYPSRTEVEGKISIKPIRADGTDGRWRWGFENAEKNIDKLLVRWMPAKKQWGVFEKDYLDKRDNARAPSYWSFKDVNNERGVETFTNYGFTRETFNNPKPVGTLKRVLQLGTESTNGDYVLDFFSGSASMAEAVMEKNAEDDGNRKFIMVQLPEMLDENSDGYKEGYKTICDIGKERIYHAGEKILKENKHKNGIEQLDVGFKVFKLDESNLHKWNSNKTEIEQNLLELVDSLKEGRTNEDVVYEILLKYGVDLTVPIDQKEIAGNTIFDVGMGYLIICLEKELELNVIEEIAKKKPTRVVFYDEGFKDDTVRTNAQQILKRYGVEDIRVI